jgi:hypothetical protein
MGCIQPVDADYCGAPMTSLLCSIFQTPKQILP